MTHAATAHQTSMGLDNRKMAFWAFIGSECLLFGSLISTYLVYKGRSVVGPYPHEILNIPFTSVSTFDLLMSSLMMVLALAAVQRGDMKWGKIWLFSTALLGLVFLGGQVIEFTEFVHKGLTMSTNLFGCTFFVLTGTHGAHVAVGLRGRGVDHHLHRGLPDPMSDEHQHPTVDVYLRVAAALVILTVLEVGVFYVPAFHPVLVPVLLVLSATKFALVVMFYMHLKADSTFFTFLFGAPLLLALGVMVALLFLFFGALTLRGGGAAGAG